MKLNIEESSLARKNIFRLKEECNLESIVAVGTLTDMTNVISVFNKEIYRDAEHEKFEFSLWRFPGITDAEQLTSERTFTATNEINTECLRFIKHILKEPMKIVVLNASTLQASCHIMYRILFKTFKAMENADKASIIVSPGLDKRHGFYQYGFVLFVNGHEVEELICNNSFSLKRNVISILETLDWNRFTYSSTTTTL